MEAFSRPWSFAVLIVALAVAVAGARPFAGGWNDGSRLATVESLVDRHTFVIDYSIFVQVPQHASPYDPDVPLLQRGTQDKLLIRDHFYSDKPPVSALLLAPVYQLLQWTTGLSARENPQRFCYAMNLVGAGLPYVVAVWGIAQIGLRLQLSAALQLLLTASFAFATVAPAYARHVNAHIQLLAVATLLYALLLRVVRQTPARPLRIRTMTGAGTCLGLAYTLDLAAGPLLVLCTLPLLVARAGWSAGAWCGVAALPFIVLHHVLSYAVSGTFLPANMTPEFFQWVGSPFDGRTLTGSWHHTPGRFLSYAAQLLVGRRGFLLHNLPLLLLIIALPAVRRQPRRERSDGAHAVCWSVATWLVYAIGSNNYSGQCLSIRWFVPLLAPAYLLLGLIIRDQSRYRGPFSLLSGWGTVLAGAMWSVGPWGHMRGLWVILAAALASNAVLWNQRRRSLATTSHDSTES